MTKIISKKDAEKDIASLEVPEDVISYVNKAVEGAISLKMHEAYFDLSKDGSFPRIYARPIVKELNAAGYKAWVDGQKLWVQLKTMEEDKTTKKGLAGFWRKFCEWDARKGQWLCLLPWLSIWPVFKDDMAVGWAYIVLTWMLVICFLLEDEEHSK